MSFQTTEPPFRFRQGTRPLLISMPHVGTHVPPALAARFTDEARQVPDTDWHLERLYDFADELGASVLVATHSRYVIDLNRPPDGASLYPGQSVTGLCPVDTFDNTPIYEAGDVPEDGVQRWQLNDITLLAAYDGVIDEVADFDSGKLNAKGKDVVVKSTSVRGNVTTDTYSLSGISAAIDRAAQECR